MCERMKISTERWNAWMESNVLGFTQEELDAGWHFCREYDGLVVGPGMDEETTCACFGGVNFKKRRILDTPEGKEMYDYLNRYKQALTTIRTASNDSEQSIWMQKLAADALCPGTFSNPGPQPLVWEDNSIQFPRLIDEADAAGAFTADVEETMALSMDLRPADVRELIERARTSWEEIKRRDL